MKAKFSHAGIVVALALAAGLTVACSRGVSDAQLAGQVQSKIAADSLVQSRQFSVQAANGVVTLSGSVNNEAERSAAANDAAQIPGVKTVVNNLEVAPPAVAQTPAPAAAPAPEPAPEPARHKAASSRPKVERTARVQTYDDTPSPAQAPAAAPAPAPAPPSPPPVQYVTVPDGTEFSVQISEALSSQRSHVGDVFHGTLTRPVVVGDHVVIPAYSDVEGRVTDAKDAGHFAGQSSLALELTSLTSGGKTYQVHTEQWAKQGVGRGKNTAEKVGGGAALGAIIGAIAGGGKGAAIGGAIGAGAGTTAQAATRGQQVELPSETVINFQLSQSVSVIPTSSNRDANRPRVE